MKRIEDFELLVGDIAMTIERIDNIDFIEVAIIEKPSLRAIYTCDTITLVSGNIPRDQIAYVTDKVKRNARFLDK